MQVWMHSRTLVHWQTHQREGEWLYASCRSRHCRRRCSWLTPAFSINGGGANRLRNKHRRGWSARGFNGAQTGSPHLPPSPLQHLQPELRGWQTVHLQMIHAGAAAAAFTLRSCSAGRMMDAGLASIMNHISVFLPSGCRGLGKRKPSWGRILYVRAMGNTVASRGLTQKYHLFPQFKRAWSNGKREEKTRSKVLHIWVILSQKWWRQWG